MQQILKLPLAAALENPVFRKGISKITSHSYTNADVLLDQEFRKNNHVYLSLSSDQQLEAFFMVGWSHLLLHGHLIDCVFLGLSAATPTLKGTSLVPNLYRQFFQHATEAAKVSNRPVAWWFHTASPIVAGLMTAMGSLEPHFTKRINWFRCDTQNLSASPGRGLRSQLDHSPPLLMQRNRFAYHNRQRHQRAGGCAISAPSWDRRCRDCPPPHPGSGRDHRSMV